jgi:hypothetical protein
MLKMKAGILGKAGECNCVLYYIETKYFMFILQLNRMNDIAYSHTWRGFTMTIHKSSLSHLFRVVSHSNLVFGPSFDGPFRSAAFFDARSS